MNDPKPFVDLAEVYLRTSSNGFAYKIINTRSQPLGTGFFIAAFK